MELEGTKRRMADLYKATPFHDGTETSWAAKASETHPYHYLDGVDFFVAEVDLDPKATWLQGPSGEINDDLDGYDDASGGDEQT